MIQIYKETNTNYTANGDVTLDPISCETEMNLNGSWEMTLELPLDPQLKFREAVINAVVCAPTPVGEKQLFRIYDTVRTSTSVIAYARPIFLDAQKEVFLTDCRPTKLNGQQALDWMMEGTGYTATCDISTTNTAYYIRKNLIEAIASDDDNSFLNRWGGEIIYDNYNIDIKVKQGTDNGLRVEFGRNISSIRETIDTDTMATRIVPVSFNGYTLDGDEPWVDSPLIDAYPIKYARVVEFSTMALKDEIDEEEYDNYTLFDSLPELQAGMIEAAEKMFEEGCDLPSTTYEIDMVDLSRMAEYKDFTDLETIFLGDTVHCYHKVLKISTDARCIGLVYDNIRRVATSVTLGDYQEDYLSRLDAAAKVSATYTDFAELATQITYIQSNYIKTDVLESTIANFGYITTDEIEAKLGEFGYITADQIDALVGSFGYITTDEIESLLGSFGYITVDEADIRYATFYDLDSFQATIENLIAGYVTIDYLQSAYARIEDLEAALAQIEILQAAYAEIDTLNSDVAAINWLLSGYTSTETQDVINLSAANVVIADATITDAMIADLSASKLTAGVIYTDNINIFDNENGYLSIIGATIIFTDINGIVREQLGLDASGLFNNYIWDAEGNLIWNALGLTEEGLLGNGAIIRDAAVADDANIAGYKLDIESVTSCLNEYGQLVVDSANITINGETLDVAYTQIVGMLSNAMCTETVWWAIGDSQEEPPCLPGEELSTTTVDDFTVDEAIVDAESWEDIWTMERLIAPEGLYLWIVNKYTYIDGTVVWDTPVCLTDGYLREQTTTLKTEFEVIQGQISSRIWMTDIQTATDGLGSEINFIQNQYTEVVQTLTGLYESVGNLESIFNDDYSALFAQVTQIITTVEGIQADISSVTEIVNSNFTYLSNQLLSIDATVQGFSVDLSAVSSTVGEMYEILDDTVAGITYYYSLSDSATEPACLPEEEFSTCLVEDFIVDEAIVDAESWEDIWTTEQPEYQKGLYTWKVTLILHTDGSKEWSAMTCLTDGYIRDTATTLTQQQAIFDIDLSSITAQVSSINTELYGDSSNIGMVEQLASAVLDLTSISLLVSETITRIGSAEVGLENLESSLTAQISEVQSLITQTATDVRLEFTNSLTVIQELQDSMQTIIEEYATYFNFSADGLLIGKSDSALSLRIQNDQISFLEYDAIVAYITQAILSIYDGRFINSLQIGNFIFIPRVSGNLSFIYAG